MIGREFTVDLLAAVCERDVSGAVEAARAARIVEPSRRERGAWLFAHAVFRETIYEQLDSDRRRELHRRAGRGARGALSRRPGPVPARPRPPLPRGRTRTTRTGRWRFSLAAGRQAASRLAHADAADHLERALELTLRRGRRSSARPASRAGRRDDPLGPLPRRAAGDPRGGRHRPSRSTTRARLALAAIALARDRRGRGQERGDDGDPRRRRSSGSATTSPRSASSSSRVSRRSTTGMTSPRRPGVGDEAVALARALGDDGALASTLVMQQFIEVGRPGTAADRLRNADELIDDRAPLRRPDERDPRHRLPDHQLPAAGRHRARRPLHSPSTPRSPRSSPSPGTCGTCR